MSKLTARVADWLLTCLQFDYLFDYETDKPVDDVIEAFDAVELVEVVVLIFLRSCCRCFVGDHS